MDNSIKTERLPNGNLKIIIPIEVRETATGRRLRVADGGPDKNEGRDALLLAIARGRRWQAFIDDGTVGGPKEIAEAIGRDVSYVTRIIRLASLSPEIIVAIFRDDYPATISLTKLGKAIPIDWNEQRAMFLGKE